VPHSQRHVRCRPHEQAVLPINIRLGEELLAGVDAEARGLSRAETIRRLIASALSVDV
jgi:hypothetical protein